MSVSNAIAQVDTTLLYDNSETVGAFDIRVARSKDDYYRIKAGETFSFRETNGARTNTYLDMTAWDSQPYQQGHLVHVRGSQQDFVLNFRILIPEGYSPQQEGGYPLVLLLHGLLERGNCAANKCYHATPAFDPNANIPAAPISASHELLNNDYNLIHGGSNYLEASRLSSRQNPNDSLLDARAYPGFVLVPQNLNGWDDAAVDDAIRLVRMIVKQYNIDEDRIFINGISHGGHGAYKAMMRAPWLFAAGILFSAADDAGATRNDVIDRISDIPLWIFQGAKDAKPTTNQTEAYIKALRQHGSSVRYTLYPNLGHGTWNKAFAEPDFFTWMLKQRKNTISVFGNDKAICKTSRAGKTLSMPRGYPSYEWKRDGMDLGENGASITVMEVGTYEGRYAKANSDGSLTWNEWSAPLLVTERDPGQASLDIIGTRFLPDLNGHAEVTLKARNPYDIYEWYKTPNRKLNFSDTLNRVAINSSFQTGDYYLSAALYDRCFTMPSNPVSIYFKDQAPYSINSPAALTASAISPVSVKLSWDDKADNENGFEIWRRRLTNSASDPWTLVNIAQANVNSFADSTLLPSSKYEYKIRAVASRGRSDYSPSRDQQPVVVSSLQDNAVPQSTTITSVSQRSVESFAVTWMASVDDSAIDHYLIVVNDDTIKVNAPDTIAVITDAAINATYQITVIVADVAGNLSEPSQMVSYLSAVNGLFYQHSTGAWESLREIDWGFAEYTGNVDRPTLKPKTQEDFFNFRFDGYIQIEKEGTYQFRISSDDGSRLQVGDSLVIINDGIHTMATTTSPVHLLAAGPHRIQIEFFDYDRSDSLVVEYKGADSGGQWMIIPPEAFTSSLLTSVEAPEKGDRWVSIFPNPAQAHDLRLRIDNAAEGSVQVQVLNTTGNVVKRVDFPINSSSTNSWPLVVDLPPGMYIFLIQLNERYFSERVVIK